MNKKKETPTNDAQYRILLVNVSIRKYNCFLI
jgi:hypothetical protein